MVTKSSCWEISLLCIVGAVPTSPCFILNSISVYGVHGRYHISDVKSTNRVS